MAKVNFSANDRPWYCLCLSLTSRNIRSHRNSNTRTNKIEKNTVSASQHPKSRQSG